MSDVAVPRTGSFFFAGHFFSAEDASVAICDQAGKIVKRLLLQDVAFDLMFYHLPGSGGTLGQSFMWAIARSGAFVWNVTNPKDPVPGETMRPVAKWTFMGGSVDPATGSVWMVENRRIDATDRFERKFWAWSGPPMTMVRGAQTTLGESMSNRGGMVLPMGKVGDRILAPTTFGEKTAVVAIDPYPNVLSTSLPVILGMDHRGSMLIGGDGDAILNARAKATGARPSRWRRMRKALGLDAARWNTWGNVGGPVPTKLHSLLCPGYLYDQSANLRAFTRNGNHFVMGGWTDGGDAEFVDLMSCSASGVLAHIRTVPMPKNGTSGMMPVLIDIPAPGDLAYVYGWWPYSSSEGWTYGVVLIRLPADLKQAKVVDTVRLHP